MKKLMIPLALFSGFFLICLFVFFWWFNTTSAPSSDSAKVNFLITKGMSASQVGIKLEKEGVIKNDIAFKIYTQVTGKSQNIQAGEYLLSKNMSLRLLVDELLKGPTQIWVTIPEGLRREQIIVKFADSLDKEGKTRENFIDEFSALTKDKEGFLFPDTYLVAKDITVAKIVNAMEVTYSKMTRDIINDQKLGLSEAQIITIASMVERETKTDAERPLVAGVLYNRLNNDWPLQVDATVQYVIANIQIKNKDIDLADIKYWSDITKSDLEIDSLYNTYQHVGLPPGPIANPGLSSIKAAVNPQTSDYFFYLHDSDGNIHLAKTLEEHNANVRKYLGK